MENVLITGASTGIGRAASELFLERGCRVIMVDKEEDKKLNDELKEKYSDKVHFYLGDVSENDTVMFLYDFAKDKTGFVDTVINNAGIILHGYLHEVAESDWDSVFNADVKSIFLTAKFFLPDMIGQKRGVIINTASISGLFGDYQMPVYNAAKGAVVNLTRAMALDYGRFGIRVNSVCPGATRTNMLKDINIEPYAKVNPMKRIAEPVDVAKVMYFLGSDDAGYVNGVNLPVTGGLDAHTGQPE